MFALPGTIQRTYEDNPAHCVAFVYLYFIIDRQSMRWFTVFKQTNTHKSFIYVCIKTLAPWKGAFARPRSFVLLFQACIFTENHLTDWSKFLICSLHQRPDRCIGIETVKLSLSGGWHQILFSFYYLSDFEPTFADETLSHKILSQSWLYIALIIIFFPSLPMYMQSSELF